MVWSLSDQGRGVGSVLLNPRMLLLGEKLHLLFLGVGSRSGFRPLVTEE